MSHFTPALNATSFPSAPGRKALTAEQWEEKHGITFELVFKASISKNKSEAAEILGFRNAQNRYKKVNRVYKAFRIKPNYSGQDAYAVITGCNTPEEIIKDWQRTANSTEYKPGTTT